MGFLPKLLFLVTLTKILELVGCLYQENIFFSEMLLLSNTYASFYVCWKTTTTAYLYLADKVILGGKNY